jgi:hypothetical protein
LPAAFRVLLALPAVFALPAVLAFAGVACFCWRGLLLLAWPAFGGLIAVAWFPNYVVATTM